MRNSFRSKMGRSKLGRSTTGPFKRTRARRRAAFPPPRHDDKRIRFLMSNDHDNPTDSGPSDSDPVEAAPARSGRKRAADTDYGAARSEEHTSELQSLMRISDAVF